MIFDVRVSRASLNNIIVARVCGVTIFCDFCIHPKSGGISVFTSNIREYIYI